MKMVQLEEDIYQLSYAGESVGTNGSYWYLYIQDVENSEAVAKFTRAQLEAFRDEITRELETR